MLGVLIGEEAREIAEEQARLARSVGKLEERIRRVNKELDRKIARAARKLEELSWENEGQI
jgi:uncharacterized protein with PhoU and TrkA domain